MHELPFLSAEDLAVFKMTIDRPKDWVDIGPMLEHRPLDEATFNAGSGTSGESTGGR